MDKDIYKKFYECKGISTNDKLRGINYLVGISELEEKHLLMSLNAASDDNEVTLAFKGFFETKGWPLSKYEKVGEVQKTDDSKRVTYRSRYDSHAYSSSYDGP